MKITNYKLQITKAFTLIELMIVMALIGILVTIGLQSYRTSQMRGRDAVRKSDLRNIQTALRLYYNDFGRYPAGTSTMTACGTGASPSACPYGSAWSRNNVTYMSVLPRDPVTTQSYVYTYIDDDNYTIRACLEVSNDPKGVAVPASTCTSLLKYEVRP